MHNKKKYTNEWIIVVLVVIMLVVMLFINAFVQFRITSEQTENTGSLQLDNIKSELDKTLAESQKDTLMIARDIERILVNDEFYDAVSDYVYEQKELQYQASGEKCINVYVTGATWEVVPGMEANHRDLKDRIWYSGALKNPDDVYITSPYVDLVTNEMCYTTSTLLSDGKTVVCLDYTLSAMQEYVKTLGGSDSSNKEALIVSDEGIIVGYTDDSLIGTEVKDTLPYFADVLNRLHDDSVISKFHSRTDGRNNTVFAGKTADGWYMLVEVNTLDMYKSSFLLLLVTFAVNSLLIVIIVVLYLLSSDRKKKAEEALTVKEDFLSRMSVDLKEPLQRILHNSDLERVFNSENPKEQMEQIKEAGLQLSDMLDNLLSFSGIVSEEKKTKDRAQNKKSVAGLNIRVRNYVMIILIIAMVSSIVVNAFTINKWGNEKMKNEVDNYQSELTNWITAQKSILDMFCSGISVNPDILDDYEAAKKYLNDITIQYPEISVSYMTNPDAEHIVIMNNGWEPEEGWHLEDRQWFVDTNESETGFNISSPYYDSQTGYYCVTLSERVYDAATGEYLGNFGIDFYMDKLVEILSESYSDTGYAFLVDADGNIINHPNSAYQMEEDQMIKISKSEYTESYNVPGQSVLFKDYDGHKKVCMSKTDKQSSFTVFVVKNWEQIYSNIIIYTLLFALMFAICVVAIFVLMKRLIAWQNEMNTQLKEAADSAIAAGKAKSSFLAQMSHEIRTPINAVLGMNEMILRESEDAEIRDYAVNIQSAGRTLLTLINSILDFSKIEDGKMEIIPVRYDTASLINDLVNVVSERAKKKGLEFTVNVDENLPKTMFGDDVRIKQVVSNILTNAVKYTDEGSVTMSILGEMTGEDTIDLKVSVKDTGIGIKEEDREKLFMSFQRLDEERNKNIEGTGLGISIVQRLLEMMGSSLMVSSVYGEGSDFYFTLSQKVVEAEPIGNYKKRLEMALLSDVHGQYLYAPEAKILVVDDNEMNLKVVKGLLKRNGIVPDLASSGYECMEMVDGTYYDIIFLDHMMPKMDGIETLKNMRKRNLLHERTLVVALTANAINGAKEQYIEAGFDDYLSKPIDVAALEARLAKHLPNDIISFKTQKESVRTKTETVSEKTVDEDVVSLELINEFFEAAPELNVLVGTNYCGGSVSFYKEMLKEYTANDKREELEKAYGEEDMTNYRVLIHALKSTSLSIGATLLSDHAKALEMEAKKENISYIKEHHQEVMEEYGKLISELKELNL